jgi:predicted glutamine amidotransferase
MCKIMAVSNFKNIKPDDLDRHLKELRDLVCVSNRDGFGYALSYEDAVFYEKFVDPSDFKGMLKSVHPKMNHPLFETGASVDQGGHYYPDVAPLAGIFHGRTSTNHKGYPEYSHPFYNERSKEAFIHNGVVQIPEGHGYQTLTKNDSEYLAHLFWDKGVKGVKDAPGYFAFLNLKPGGVLEVVRDDYAHLYGAYSSTLEGFIFATGGYMITQYAKEFKLDISAVSEVSMNTYAVVMMDAIKKSKEFTRRDNGYKLTAKEQLAFKDYSKKDYSSNFQTPAVKAKTAGPSTTKAAALRDVNAGIKTAPANSEVNSGNASSSDTITQVLTDNRRRYIAGRWISAGMSCVGLNDEQLRALAEMEGVDLPWMQEYQKEAQAAGLSEDNWDLRADIRAAGIVNVMENNTCSLDQENSADPFYFRGDL